MKTTKHFSHSFLVLMLFIGTSTLYTALAQPIDWEAVKDRYAEKYQPQQIPDWLFPIIFKDATGARDTIFFGYDDEASPTLKIDTTFGEPPIPADSSIFNAYWGGCPLCDTFSIADINITGGNANSPYGIEFINGPLPVTMYFDASFLEDPILPFPDLPLAPDVQMEVSFSSPLATHNNDFSWFCNVENVVLSDSMRPNQPMIDNCVFSDSVVFTSHPDILTWMGPINGIRLNTWTGMISGNATSEPAIRFDFYPNPADQYLFIESETSLSGKIDLLDLSGRPVYSGMLQNVNNISIPTATLPHGLFLLRIETEAYVIVNRVVVFHP